MQRVDLNAGHRVLCGDEGLRGHQAAEQPRFVANAAFAGTTEVRILLELLQGEPSQQPFDSMAHARQVTVAWPVANAAFCAESHSRGAARWIRRVGRINSS